jgi:hypothetical protein
MLKIAADSLSSYISHDKLFYVPKLIFSVLFNLLKFHIVIN